MWVSQHHKTVTITVPPYLITVGSHQRVLPRIGGVAERCWAGCRVESWTGVPWPAVNTPVEQSPDAGRPAIRWPLRLVAVLVLAEGVTLVAFAASVGIAALADPPEQPALALATLGLLVLGGAALGYAGLRLMRGRGRVRALVIVAQLLIGAIGYDYATRGEAAGTAAILLAALTVILLVLPSSTEVLAGPRGEDSSEADSA